MLYAFIPLILSALSLDIAVSSASNASSSRLLSNDLIAAPTSTINTIIASSNTSLISNCLPCLVDWDLLDPYISYQTEVKRK